MSKENRRIPHSEFPDRSENLDTQPMKISPEALELLRSARIPAEFLTVAGDTPREEMLPPSDREDLPTSVENEAPSLPAPATEIPVEPETRPWPEESSEPEFESPVEAWEKRAWTEPEELLELPEETDAVESTDTLYMTDLTLDLSRVAHMTPGLEALVGAPLKWIVSSNFFWLGGAGKNCPKCRLVILIDEKLWEKGSFKITNDLVEREGALPQRVRTKIRNGYRRVTGSSRSDFPVKTKAKFEKLLTEWQITDPDDKREILQYFATGHAVAGARDLVLELSKRFRDCFYIWEFNTTTSFRRLRSYKVKDGEPQDGTEYKSMATPSFAEMLPELTDGKGRIDELVVFHHGAKAKESKILEFLQEILVDKLKIPVCRLVYWACNAAVSIDFAPGAKLEAGRAGKAALELMEGFRSLSLESACECDEPVEFVYPTEGKCYAVLPIDAPKIQTNDGQVRRIRFGFRQADGSIGRSPLDPGDPKPSRDVDPEPEKGEVLGLEVTPYTPR